MKKEKKTKIKSVKLNEIFNCDGLLYSIAISNSTSTPCNLNYGRNIIQFDIL